jgi:hypothetical protein
MLRLIIKCTDQGFACNIGGPGTVPDISMKTFDVDLPEVEKFLRPGKAYPFVMREVIGVEVIDR